MNVHEGIRFCISYVGFRVYEVAQAFLHHSR